MHWRGLKNLLFGQPLETSRLAHERLPKWKALAVFSSDALSSVAYATQEILIPLSLISVASMTWSLPIALAIGILLVVVSSSYWQTIRSYPSGGGAYVVARENLGNYSGLITAAALLIDYVLTVSVSAAAGVEAITSAVPFLLDYKVSLGCLAIMIVTLINLRGVRESGTIFSLPTYFFIFTFSIMILMGFLKLHSGTLVAKAGVLQQVYPEIGIVLLLKAFSSGCAALTGIEAISNGVPAFRSPESRNARITLVLMVAILGLFFISTTALTHELGIVPHPTGEETVISMLARDIFGHGILYYAVQVATAMILFMAANTSFADFPRVCSLLARDRFLPRQLAGLGDRLVFSKGIVILGLFSAGLIVIFRGTTHYLIPLYAVGVFLSFTFSQSGMVRYHLREREKNWHFSILLNGIGAIVTFVVLCVLGFSKFLDGAWIVFLVIPILVVWFRATREHYRKAAAQLALADDVDLSRQIKHTVLLPISGLHRGVIDAIKYARSISSDVRALYVELDPAAAERLKTQWAALKTGIRLDILPSPYRSVVGPILDYIHNVEKEADDDIVTVVIPEFVTAHWWEGIYHNQTAFVIRAALLFERGKVVTSVRYHLSR